MKAYNGNILRHFHLNNGNSMILTKITLIKSLVIKHRPDIISFNESNVELSEAEHVNPIEEYNWEHATAEHNDIDAKISRACLGIKNTINYKRCKQFESENCQTVCIEILSGSKKIYIFSIYREWAISKIHNTGGSGSPGEQKFRFQYI